jgi:hypothetical protein
VFRGETTLSITSSVRTISTVSRLSLAIFEVETFFADALGSDFFRTALAAPDAFTAFFGAFGFVVVTIA